MKKRLLVMCAVGLLPLALLSVVLGLTSRAFAQTLTEGTPAAPLAVEAPAISIDMTVGTNPAVCANTESVSLPAGGGTATYCYEVINTGNVTLTRHTLVDTELGTILTEFPFTLVPGASAFLTQSAAITMTTVSTATWTAFNPGPADEASATDSARVHVPAPAIELQLTVGTDPAVCAPTGRIDLPPGGGSVTYCYEVTNTGGITLTRHTLVDTELGAILTDFPFTLVPGASAFLTQSATIMGTTVSTATWTAFNPGPIDPASAVDEALVTVSYYFVYLPAIRQE
jgi:hypothetical protein